MSISQDGLDAWLRYAPLANESRVKATQISIINVLIDEENDKSPVFVAGKELQLGLSRILNQHVQIHFGKPSIVRASIIIGTLDNFRTLEDGDQLIPKLEEDGFWLARHSRGEADETTHIVGQNERGALYGAFEYLMRLAQGDLGSLPYTANPSAPIRWSNHWDNLDGTIERGYGGPSIFFENGKVVQDLSRVAQLARLMASIRLNGIIVNNVNAHSSLLSQENLKGLGRIADVMRPYGVRIGIALYFDAPKQLGGLSTSDPLDPEVVKWWNDKTEAVHQQVPDLIGYLIKANSEGQPGPLTYGRTLSDAANMFARALKRVGDGLVMYRAFVYDHHLDESNWKNDRANAAVEYFKDLDADFDDNVVVQIKFGPIDFQVREPPSPLLASLRKTNVVIEFQVCQEYLGQQSHYVYQAPLWKTILDFDMRIDNKSSTVRDILSGKSFGWKNSGYAAVINTGSDKTWLGHHLSMSNFYAYGRLAWDPTLDAQEIVEDWTRLTFGLSPDVVDIVTRISMESWPAYENYSGNLGIQTLCDIIYTHYGPSPGSQDGNGWGQWTRATTKSIGMDRTSATGSGNAAQYQPEVAAKFENVETTPDDLLLWFHHVPYTHRLKSGKTVIQHFYDAHYTGAETAQTFPNLWSKLRGLIDEGRYEHVAFRLNYQAGHSIVWRDAVNRFYLAKCGIPDDRGRVNSHPWRIAAKDMFLDGYEIVDVTPAETATGGKAIVTTSKTNRGTATLKMDYPSGDYNIAIGYYDHLGGSSQYEVFLNDKSIGKWKANLKDHLLHDFSSLLDGHSATRITLGAIGVEKGDSLKIVGFPDGEHLAPLDYIAMLPEGVID